MQRQDDLQRTEDLTIPQSGDSSDTGIIAQLQSLIQFDLRADLPGTQLDGITNEIFAVSLADLDLVSVCFTVIGEHGVYFCFTQNCIQMSRNGDGNLVLIDDVVQVFLFFQNVRNVIEDDLGLLVVVGTLGNGHINLIMYSQRILRDVPRVANGYLKRGEYREFRSLTGARMVTFLNTENRLNLVKKCNARDLHDVGAKNVLEALYLAGRQAAEQVGKMVRDVFKNTDIYFDYSNPGVLQFRSAKYFDAISKDDYVNGQDELSQICNLRTKLKELFDKPIPSPDTPQEELSNMFLSFRAELKKLHTSSDSLSGYKEQGRSVINDSEVLDAYDKMLDLCCEIGFFIVPVGELESWLVDYGVPKSNHKSKWIINALTKLQSITYDSEKNVWKFVDKLKHYLAS